MLILYKPVYKDLFLIKTAYFTWYFFGGFLFETKTKQIFTMLFEIYFKINLVVPLGFKVINVKNLHSKSPWKI